MSLILYKVSISDGGSINICKSSTSVDNGMAKKVIMCFPNFLQWSNCTNLEKINDCNLKIFLEYIDKVLIVNHL